MRQRVERDVPRLWHVESVGPRHFVATPDQDLCTRSDVGILLPLCNRFLIELEENAFSEQLDGRVNRVAAPIWSQIRVNQCRIGAIAPEAAKCSNLSYPPDLPDRSDSTRKRSGS